MLIVAGDSLYIHPLIKLVSLLDQYVAAVFLLPFLFVSELIMSENQSGNSRWKCSFLFSLHTNFLISNLFSLFPSVPPQHDCFNRKIALPSCLVGGFHLFPSVLCGFHWKNKDPPEITFHLLSQLKSCALSSGFCLLISVFKLFSSSFPFTRECFQGADSGSLTATVTENISDCILPCCTRQLKCGQKMLQLLPCTLNSFPKLVLSVINCGCLRKDTTSQPDSLALSNFLRWDDWGTTRSSITKPRSEAFLL